MRPPREVSGGRRGLSLMEVLVALTIFLLAFVALGRLVTLGSDQAADAQQQVQAVDLCQTKLAEVAAGAIPLESQSQVPFEEDPTWQWSLDCEKSNFPGLWNVTVQIRRQQQGARVLSTLTQMLLDPQNHGSLQDTPPGTTTDSSSSTSGRSSRSGGTAGAAGGGS